MSIWTFTASKRFHEQNRVQLTALSAAGCTRFCRWSVLGVVAVAGEALHAQASRPSNAPTVLQAKARETFHSFSNRTKGMGPTE